MKPEVLPITSMIHRRRFAELTEEFELLSVLMHVVIGETTEKVVVRAHMADSPCDTFNI